MAGVLVALAAQATLYLSLRRIAVATMPAWAHGLAHHHHPSIGGSIPAVVGVALVAGAAPAAAPDTRTGPVMAPPTLLQVPVLPVPLPVLSTGPGHGGSDP